ncbi:MAG: endo alpha-1,4 polygalactosaminidase [Candidatus Aminicenantes bacterium]|nr:endo alpha-1,4 polygalactosaminidase [Candidatus Aminicenantes bacterium]
MGKKFFPLFCLSILLLSCNSDDPSNPGDNEYRAHMRGFVQAIAVRARNTAGASFGIFPQNGCELTADSSYLAAINGSGNEDVFYGYTNDNTPTLSADSEYFLGYLKPQVSAGKLVLVTDYCTSRSYVDDSYAQCAANGFVGYCAVRELDAIVNNGHMPTAADSHDCRKWSDVKHFLYVINPRNFSSAAAFINAVAATYYDLVIIDAYFEDRALSAAQIDALKTKPDGKRRLVLAYMSIGEAEDYRWYWQSGWTPGHPDWLGQENPEWEGNYAVAYWQSEWQAIIFQYADIVMAAGFDGLYLDKIDEYEYWEEKG